VQRIASEWGERGRRRKEALEVRVRAWIREDPVGRASDDPSQANEQHEHAELSQHDVYLVVHSIQQRLI